ncbi:MAG: hypothetical protein IH878_15945 [Gemmatimonadetes bacterium]|jgi:hypothetical protein|nr:hypothetical protein [Gemmatimonadota bacterium]
MWSSATVWRRAELATLHSGFKAFAPDFFPSILRGEMTLYKMSEHNALLVDGLRKAGLPE